MKTSDFLFSEQFFLLQLLENNEEYINNELIIKMSQDKMAKELNINKHKINSYIKELKSHGFLEKNTSNAKYQLTKLAHDKLHQLTDYDKKEKASQFKCASFFAGVGGIDLGFEKVGFNTIYANEFDPMAVKTYEKNFRIKVDCRDIREVVNDLQSNNDPFQSQNFNILLAGFPCQAFSVAGYREGFDDKKGRGDLFFEIMKIVKIKHPDVIFLENVKNLLNHDKGKTFQIIKDSLESEGYFIKKDILNSMIYGNVPQNRERIYIVAFKDKKKWEKFKFPCPIPLENKLSNVIDFKNKKDDKFYYTEKFLHYDELKKNITSQDTVYQWRRKYVRSNKSNVCPTLTANMGMGGHNVPLVLTDFGIRKLTPQECFAMQGFPNTYSLPADISMSYLYKQAGNSVSVTVIEKIAEEILKVL